MKKCAENFNRFCPDYPEKCRFCGAFREPTNADRIRAMSDEELSELIDRETDSCAPTGDCEKMSRDCKACWLEWLQQPAREEDKHEAD